MPRKRSAKDAKAIKSSKRVKVINDKITDYFSVADGTASELASNRQVSPPTNTTDIKRPVPFGKPPVWADKKQQLCEALYPWFNTYQAGVYRKDNFAYGILVDGGFGPRDKLNEELLITRA